MQTPRRSGSAEPTDSNRMCRMPQSMPTPQPWPTRSSPSRMASRLPPTVRDLNETERQQLEDRWQAIEPLTRFCRKPTAEEFHERATELAAAGRPCSVRTLRRLFARWQQGHQDRLALLPKTHERGGRGQVRPQGLLKRYPVIGQLVERAINDVYLTMARRPISAVVRRVIEDDNATTLGCQRPTPFRFRDSLRSREPSRERSANLIRGRRIVPAGVGTSRIGGIH